jgi:outer membrane immunogenic protein
MRSKIVSLLAAAFSLALVPAASAADMPTKAPMAPVAVPYNCTGIYVGGVAGYGWGTGEHCQIGFGCNAVSPITDPKGWSAGVTLGYNWQWANWVLGIEGDWSWANIKAASPSTAGFGCIAPAGVNGCFTKIQSYETLRARAGWAFDRFLPYVTAGVAWSQLNASMGAVTVSSGTTTKTGFVVGGGLEYAFWQNLSAKVEYLYISRLGDFTYDNGAACGAALPCYVHVGGISEVRFGLNYRFTGL